MNPFELLANAIIVQAVKDYREASEKLSHGRKNQKAQEIHEDCLSFFRSQWYKQLTGLNPDILIRKLDEEVSDYDG